MEKIPEPVESLAIPEDASALGHRYLKHTMAEVDFVACFVCRKWAHISQTGQTFET